jgi:hypothetical protein
VSSLAYWRPLRNKSNSVTNTFGGGINTYLPPFDIEDGELTDALNMCSDDFPNISVRPGRSTYIKATTETGATPALNALGVRNNQFLSVLAKRGWRLYNTVTPGWSTLSTTIADSEGKFAEFNTEVENRTLLVVSSELYQYNGTAVERITQAPNSTNNKACTLITTHRQRAWMAFDKTAYFTAVAKSTDWTTALEAGRIPIVNAKGNITGLTTFDDHVYIFTEHSMHCIFGTSPFNYELVDISNEIGCISDKSIIEISGVLYFCSYGGVYAFRGGLPVKISDKMQSIYDQINLNSRAKIVSQKKGDKLYISVPIGTATENNRVLVFDTKKNSWFVEDGSFKYMTNIKDNLYGQNSTGEVMLMVSTSTKDSTGEIAWQFETKAYAQGAGYPVTLPGMDLMYKASTTLAVGFSTGAESTTYTDIATAAQFSYGSTDRVKRINVQSTNLQDVPFYKLKFSGTGPATIRRLRKMERMKGGSR